MMGNAVLPRTLLLLFHIGIGATAAQQAAGVVPALFVFGDSLVDGGNENALAGALAKADYFPYGLDFLGGRFCNGKTVVDALCDLLGLDYLPPFTSTTAEGGPSLLGGVSYASAAGGVLDDTGRHLGARFSLGQQVASFGTSLDALRAQVTTSGADLAQFLARSVAVMVLGGNDYVNNYLLTSLYDTSDKYGPEEFAALLVDRYATQIRALYSVGLRKFLMAGLGPLGCVPWLRASSSGQQGQCVDQVNRMVGFFNQGLMSLVDRLNADHTDPDDATFVYVNTYDAVLDMIGNPDEYGLTVVDSACCGLGKNRAQQVTCLPLLQPCDDRDQYLFWDAYHPTQAANLVLAQKAFNGTQEHVHPLNLQQLMADKL